MTDRQTDREQAKVRQTYRQARREQVRQIDREQAKVTQTDREEVKVVATETPGRPRREGKHVGLTSRHAATLKRLFSACSVIARWKTAERNDDDKSSSDTRASAAK